MRLTGVRARGRGALEAAAASPEFSSDDFWVEVKICTMPYLGKLYINSRNRIYRITTDCKNYPKYDIYKKISIVL